VSGHTLASLCASPPTAWDAARTDCLGKVLDHGGACENPVKQACDLDADCAAMRSQCFPLCPG
jgi:hypothetical protein